MGWTKTVLPLGIAAISLLVSIDAVSTHIELEKASPQLTTSASTLLRRSLKADVLSEPAGQLKEERGYTLKDVSAWMPFTRAATEAKNAAKAKRLEEIRTALLHKQRDEVLTSKFAQFFLDNKTPDDVVNIMKAAGKREIEYNSIRTAYEEWLEGILSMKIK
ncbi:secreted RxLR effector peptide protein, putative [Phytophthora infestans T30-4]|uniref:Secreted RxLR effector peptide protein n=2 Tax=Phytophthora infestans TaxID=4787 RepID=A0A8S9UBT8_PHYIN